LYAVPADLFSRLPPGSAWFPEGLVYLRALGKIRRTALLLLLDD
jgi:hypothetical protein